MTDIQAGSNARSTKWTRDAAAPALLAFSAIQNQSVDDLDLLFSQPDGINSLLLGL